MKTISRLTNRLLLLFACITFTKVAVAQGNNMGTAIITGNFGDCGGNSYYDSRDIGTSSYSSNYGNASKEVFYKVNVLNTTQLTVKTCFSDFDTKVYLLNSVGTQIAVSSSSFCPDDAQQTGSLVANVGPGVYYVVVEEANGGSSANLNLAISCPPTGTAQSGDLVSAPIHAGLITQFTPFTHVVNLSSANCYQDNNGRLGPEVYYYFTINEASLVTISNCGSTVPTELMWIDMYEDWIDGGVINGPVCPGSAMSFSMVFNAGTYLIRVEAVDNFQHGNVTTNISIGAVPPDPTDPGIICSTQNPTLDCTPMAAAFSKSQNYIVTTVPKRKGFLHPAQLSNRKIGDMNQSVQYFDGLGRPLQNIQLKGNSAATRDVVQHFAYDNMGRENIKYLSYAAPETPDGSYKSNAITAGQGIFSFFNPPGSQGTQLPNGVVRTPYPISETVFQAGALNRIAERGAPGESWQKGNGHTSKFEYAGNTTTDQVKHWTINSNGALSSNFYGINRLYKTVTKDENWKITDGKAGCVEEYKTKQGQLILKKMWETDTKSLNTYYLYDEYNNLRYVLPPAVNESGQNLNSFTENEALFNEYIYAYHYDDLNRIIEKKVPGKGWEYIVYNKFDQPVLSQDAEQRKRNVWLVTRYDNFGRSVMTGTWNNGNTAVDRNTLANQVYLGLQWDIKNNSHAHGYELKCYPTVMDTVLSVNYYDDYNIAGLPSAYDKHLNHSNRTKGLLTASKILVLSGSNDMLWNVSYYDDKGRNTRQISQHYKGGILSEGNYDETINTYSFTNELLSDVRSHKVGGVEKLNVKLTHSYDHVGKLINTWQRIDNAADSVLLVKNEYNDIGQLVTKRLHASADLQPAVPEYLTLNSADIVQNGQQKEVTATASIVLSDGFEAKSGSVFRASIVASSFLQTIRYAYNERGWLKEINNPAALAGTEAFGMKMLYGEHPDPARQQFNGNISAFSWQSKVPVSSGFSQQQQSYDYLYDRLNRLTLASYTTPGKTGYFDESLSYDLMGNLATLQRKSSGSVIDELVYGYANANKSNRLVSVTDNSGSNEGLVNGVTTYTHDDNGSLVSEDRKALQVQYNLLNLPKLIRKTTTNETIAYIYDAAGRKLRKVNAGNSRDYVDGIEYDNAGNLDFFHTPEGRVVKSGTTYSYEYMLKDHLGNTRSVVKQDGSILQVPDYYAFGMELNHNVLTPSPDNRYKYNGKEMQTELGLGQLDYGARFYDPVIGRWNVVDPLAEFHFNVSPYNYVLNNPIKYIDPFGLDTVRRNQLVSPMPGVRQFNPNVDVIQLEEFSVMANKPARSAQDNTRNEAGLMVSENSSLAMVEQNRTLGLANYVQTRIDVVHEVNPKFFKFAPYSGNTLKLIDLMNSNNGEDAANKVMGFALEQAASKFIGGGPILGIQLANGYFNETEMGLNDMAAAEYREMMFNRRQYRITKDEMYLKREDQASRRMYEYLRKKQNLLKEKK